MGYGGTWGCFLAQPSHMRLPSGSLSHHVARGILVPQPDMQPVPTVVETWSPDHWTAREGSGSSLLILIPVTLYLLLTWKREVLKGSVLPLFPRSFEDEFWLGFTRSCAFGSAPTSPAPVQIHSQDDDLRAIDRKHSLPEPTELISRSYYRHLPKHPQGASPQNESDSVFVLEGSKSNGDKHIQCNTTYYNTNTTQ